MALEEAEIGHRASRPTGSLDHFSGPAQCFFACGFQSFLVIPEERLNVTLFGLSGLTSWLVRMVEIYSAK